MGKTAVVIDLTDSERRELGSLAARRKTAQGLAQRARMVLLAAEGVENKDICTRLGASPNTVGKWRRRFAERRLEGLLDEPRPGAPRQIGDDEVAEIVRLTLETTPRDATHWSLRSMAKAVGSVRNFVRGAIIAPMEGEYGDQEGHAGRSFGWPRPEGCVFEGRSFR